MSKKVMILCEDTYGVDFLKDLTNRLRNEGLIPNHFILDANKFYGPCNPKLYRQMRAKAYFGDYRFFIIVADANGNSRDQMKERIENHIPNELRDSTFLVILKYEMEEWICISKGIRINDKPSYILKCKENYQKYKLRDYVEKLDITILMKKCESFNKYVGCFHRIYDNK